MNEPSGGPFDDPKAIYKGNKIPLFIKLAWVVLGLWIVSYMAIYTFPDLTRWF